MVTVMAMAMVRRTIRKIEKAADLLGFIFRDVGSAQVRTRYCH
jgi:peptide methionine sulfoxide reductase MsrB